MILLHKRSIFSLCFAALLSLAYVADLYSQKHVEWDILADVTFDEKFDEESGMYWLIPQFGKKVKSFENKEIEMEGYLIPVDAEGKFYVLSRFPYSSCFFCGAAGPESILEIVFTKDIEHQSMDDIIRIRGKLQLNADDFERFNYILEETVILSDE